MKIFICLILTLIISSAHAIEYIQKFNKVSYNESFDLEKQLQANNCTEIDLQKEIFFHKNKITNKTKKVWLQTCYQEETFTDEQLSIVQWQDYKVSKGFILSQYIESQNCKDIYTKQIPHFYLKNHKSPKDVNIIRQGQLVKVQTCIVPEVEPVIEEIAEEPSTINTKKQTYKLYAYSKNEDKSNTYGLGYKNSWMNSFVLFGKKNTNLELNPSILKTSIFSLQGYVGYQNKNNDTDLYANLGINVSLGKLTAQSIFDYKKQGSFLGLSYQIINPINIQTFYYQREIGFGLKYYFNY